MEDQYRSIATSLQPVAAANQANRRAVAVSGGLAYSVMLLPSGVNSFWTFFVVALCGFIALPVLFIRARRRSLALLGIAMIPVIGAIVAAGKMLIGSPLRVLLAVGAWGYPICLAPYDGAPRMPLALLGGVLMWVALDRLPTVRNDPSTSILFVVAFPLTLLVLVVAMFAPFLGAVAVADFDADGDFDPGIDEARPTPVGVPDSAPPEVDPGINTAPPTAPLAVPDWAPPEIAAPEAELSVPGLAELQPPEIDVTEPVPGFHDGGAWPSHGANTSMEAFDDGAIAQSGDIGPPISPAAASFATDIRIDPVGGAISMTSGDSAWSWRPDPVTNGWVGEGGAADAGSSPIHSYADPVTGEIHTQHLGATGDWRYDTVTGDWYGKVRGSNDIELERITISRDQVQGTIQIHQSTGTTILREGVTGAFHAQGPAIAFPLPPQVIGLG